MSDDKQVLLNKLSTIFDPTTAIDFICPKTFEPRKHLTIEDIKHGDYSVSYFFSSSNQLFNLTGYPAFRFNHS